jgi:hypothetical protein
MEYWQVFVVSATFVVVFVVVYTGGMAAWEAFDRRRAV